MPEQLKLTHENLDKLAFSLFRRYLIDKQEIKKLYFKPPTKEQLTEHKIERSWNGMEGRERSYWFMLARECQKLLNNEPPTSLPS